MSHRYVLLANGFEEIEAITILDILHRGGVPATTVAVGTHDLRVVGAHGVPVTAQIHLEDVVLGPGDSVILPGGLPGAQHLWENERVLDLVRQSSQGTGITAAICAAPAVLGTAGLLEGRRATSYPGFQPKVAAMGATIVQDPVVKDGRIITSKGPATAMDFALALVAEFAGQAKADQVAQDLLLVPA